jgi:hypothetical protein
MTTADKWGTGQPKDLQEALTSVRTSYDRLGTGMPKTAMVNHVATVEDAADTLSRHAERQQQRRRGATGPQAVQRQNQGCAGGH